MRRDFPSVRRVRLRIALVAAATLLSCAAAQSAAEAEQNAGGPVTLVESPRPLLARAVSEKIMTSANGRQHRIVVSAPQGEAPAGGFPVFYILDGEAFFGLAVQIAQMREYEKLDPAVIVGVGYPKRSFYDGDGRSFDFTPPGSDDPGMEGVALGGADEFLSFLNGTLKPWVQAHYSVNSERQTLFGHSLGGLFALYALFKAPESFAVYLAASPSMGFSDRIVLKGEAAFEANAARTKARLLLTVGGLESHPAPELVEDYRRYFTQHPEAIPGLSVSEVIDEMFAMRPNFDKIAETRALGERLARSGVPVTFAEFEGEEHLSAAVNALNRGIPFALRPAH